MLAGVAGAPLWPGSSSPGLFTLLEMRVGLTAVDTVKRWPICYANLLCQRQEVAETGVLTAQGLNISARNPWLTQLGPYRRPSCQGVHIFVDSGVYKFMNFASESAPRRSHMDGLHVRQTRNAFSHSRKLPNKRRANLRMCVCSSQHVRMRLGVGVALQVGGGEESCPPAAFKVYLWFFVQIWFGFRCLCQGTLTSISGTSARDFGPLLCDAALGRSNMLKYLTYNKNNNITKWSHFFMWHAFNKVRH